MDTSDWGKKQIQCRLPVFVYFAAILYQVNDKFFWAKGVENPVIANTELIESFQIAG